jgi:serine/threonine protein kinase
VSDSVQREEAVFEAALKLAQEQRAAYLREVCGGDAQLRARVEALLQATEPPVGPEKTMAVSMQLTEKPGDRIGRYKLLQQIGEGGCGVVYMADQEEPIKRRVALKVIKPGMDTKEVLGRFEAERQALALLDHPNISKVLDAGATETGRPFFAMELVRGIPITRYCDENKLKTEQRLELFIQVCQAIQHAHQKGIIHRDIKPSNILVADHDGVPVPKIIDFGIAKATAGQTLTDKTVFTALEQFIGTPAYMSPEQAKLSGLDIDTRSDIYSLGVLLYELLTGKTPFDAKRLVEAGFDEIRRIIREEEPPRPSQKLSTLAAAEQTTTARARQTDSPRLIHLVRGDLDWIVMKCLEKDRNRRYETANELASDIMHHANNEPVLARPPSNLYRFQKMVRRNKLRFAAATLIAVVLMTGTGICIYLLTQYNDAFQFKRWIQEDQQKNLTFILEQQGWSPTNINAALLVLLEDGWSPTNITASLRLLAEARVRNGRWKDAAMDYSNVVELEPTNFFNLDNLSLAALLVQSGDLAGYRRHCSQVMARYGSQTHAMFDMYIAEDCLILPGSGVDLEAIGNFQFRTNPNIHGLDPFIPFIKGLVEYRRGHFGNAAEWEQKALAEGPTPCDADYAKAWMVLAMAQCQLKRSEEARSSLAKGVEIIDTKLPKLESGDIGADWENWIIAHALLKEAKELIEGQTNVK